MLMNRYWLAVFVAGFFGGILVRSFIDFGWALVGLLASVSFTILIFCFFAKNYNSRTVLFVAIAFLGAAVGVGRYELREWNSRPELFAEFVGERQEFTAVVVDERDERETNARLTVKIQHPALDERVKVLISAPPYPEFDYGDRLKIVGKLTEPQKFTSEDGRDFDWPSYLAREGIHYQMLYPEIELVDSDGGFFLRRWLISFKRLLLENIARVIPEPASSLAGGLTLGAKQSMGRELLEDFRKTGVIHIVVLSGYNVSIVADWIRAVFAPLGQKLAIGLGVVGVILFALMTGGGAATVRASIMALIALLARGTGRRYEVTIALVTAAFLMVLHNPKIIVFDTGFQLSFLATLGIIYLAPIFEKYLQFVPAKLGLRELAVMTLSAQTSVIPWILYKMGDLSLVALPVNLLILAFVPMTMFFGFATGFVGLLGYLVSLPFAWASFALLWYELKVVEIFAGLPFASVHFNYFPLWLTLLVYGGYVYWSRRLLKRNDPDSLPGRSEIGV